MVKSYLKFEHAKTFGQICTNSDVVWMSSQSYGSATTSSAGIAIVGANEDVLCWDIKRSELLSKWSEDGNEASVTTICQSSTDNDVFAVGYEDGKIRVWDSRTASVVIVFTGHRSAVTQLKFDPSGVRLASGSRDTDITLWDLVAERGLIRLKGHRDKITSLNFLHRPRSSESPAQGDETMAGDEDEPGFLVSTSKDALIKLWDLSSQYCIETHVTQSNGECWSLGLSTDQSGCITAGNQGELRVWSIDILSLLTPSRDQSEKVLKDRGSFYRHGKDRTVQILFHPNQNLVAFHGSEKAVEIWRVRNESEIQRKLARRNKRKRSKESAADPEVGLSPGDGKVESISAASVSDIFEPYVIVRTGGKVRAMDWSDGKSGKSVSILVGTANNQIETYNIVPAEKGTQHKRPDYIRTFSVDMPGHRADVRCLALSSDDRMLASASHGSLKVWNILTQTCIRTLDCGYALSTAFLPGDKIVVIGTQEGTLEMIDIASSTLLETIKAHEQDLWSLHVRPDGKSLVTGSADKTAKFWDFRVVQVAVPGSTTKVSKLSLVHTRTLKVSDDILSIRFSPDARLLAVSTLDSTVKVFYSDSLKLFLTLYGHKLPVLSMDISYDSRLIVTSSADKNVRLWGLDFGDCHRAFFAHQDSIMSVAFVPNNRDGNGHHFFSASKDKVIKYYDGDKFEQIQKLHGHQGEIWALAIARSGELLISASHDKSIRLWQQTDEQIFLEEEREKELEELYESALLTSIEQDNQEMEGEDQVVSAGRPTMETLTAGEKIADALRLGLEDLELMEEFKKMKNVNPKVVAPSRNPVFLANHHISASNYVLKTFQRIPAASLQDALLVLLFSQLPALFSFLSIWANERKAVPLTCRILFFIIKTYQNQLISSRLMKSSLEEVRRTLRGALQAQKIEIGFNLAGLKIAGRRIGELSEPDFVNEDVVNEEKANQRKRAFINMA